MGGGWGWLNMFPGCWENRPCCCFCQGGRGWLSGAGGGARKGAVMWLSCDSNVVIM